MRTGLGFTLASTMAPEAQADRAEILKQQPLPDLGRSMTWLVRTPCALSRPSEEFMGRLFGHHCVGTPCSGRAATERGSTYGLPRTGV